MIELNPADQDIIMDMLVPLDPREHGARLIQHFAVTCGALVSVLGEKRAYEVVQRAADHIPGIDR